jgi:hypothetical protein
MTILANVLSKYVQDCMQITKGTRGNDERRVNWNTDENLTHGRNFIVLFAKHALYCYIICRGLKTRRS